MSQELFEIVGRLEREVAEVSGLNQQMLEDLAQHGTGIFRINPEGQAERVTLEEFYLSNIDV